MNSIVSINFTFLLFFLAFYIKVNLKIKNLRYKTNKYIYNNKNTIYQIFS